MPVTKEQAQMLAALGIACRPVAAPSWDEAGLMAALAKVRHLALADVIHAVVRAAADRTAQTPGVLTSLDSLHWGDRPANRNQFPTSAPEAARRQPPKRGEECAVHPGEWASVCRCCATEGRAAEPDPADTPPAPEPDPALPGPARVRAALRAAKGAVGDE